MASLFAYIGSIIVQDAGEPISDSLLEKLIADMTSALEARQIAVQWGSSPQSTIRTGFRVAGTSLHPVSFGATKP